MTVDDLIDDLLRREGGFVNHPADRGGPTNYGITQATLGSWLQRTATIFDVQELDEQTARDIYRQRYYLDPKIDTLPEAIQAVVFDWGVNSGPGTAIKALQETLDALGYPCAADGKIGPETRKQATAATAALGPKLINKYCDRREAFYYGLVARNASQSVFLKGWLNRAREFRVPEDAISENPIRAALQKVRAALDELEATL